MKGMIIRRLLPIVFLCFFMSQGALNAQEFDLIDPDLNKIAANSSAFEVAENGTIVGIAGSYSGFNSGAVWTKEAGTTFLPVLEGDEFGEAYDITESGIVAGTSVYVEHSHIYFFYFHAVTWVDGQPVELETQVVNPTGMELWAATGINEKKQICGWGRPGGTPPSHGFFVDEGLVHDLGQGTMPEDINEQGHFVGAHEASGFKHAFVWKNGSLIDLHDSTAILGPVSAALAINEFGAVVGYAKHAQFETATLWDHGVIKDLGTFGGNHSMARDINDHGTIVGHAELGGLQGVHAFIYRDGQIHDLNDLANSPANSGWTLVNAHAISNNGTVVGDGFFNGVPRAYVAYPISDGSFRIYGEGCSGSGNYTPALYGQGDPTSGGEISIAAVNGMGGGMGLLLLGTGYDTYEFKPGCTLQILPLLPPQVLIFLGGSGAGAGALQIETQLPLGLLPSVVNLQMLLVDSGGSAGFTVTNPLEMSIM